MGYHCLVPLSAAIANFIICIVVLRQGMREALNRAFAWMVLTLAAWNVDIFCLYYFADAASAEWWSRLFRTGVCLAPPAALHFALVLSRTNGRAWRCLLIAAYGNAIFLVVANMLGLLVSELTPHPWGWYVERTPVYSALTVSLVLLPPLWVERAWRAYRRPTSSRQRVQAKFFLLAGLTQLPFSLTNLLPLYGFSTYPLGDVGSVLFAGVIAYAIVRHRLMDVDYVVRKGVSFLTASVAVLGPGAVGLAALAHALDSQEPLILVSAAVALALLAVVLIPTLQAALETQVHRALFPRLYDDRRRLRDLGAQLIHVLDQGELVERLGQELFDILDVSSCQVFVRDEQTGRLALAHPAPAAAECFPNEALPYLERLRGPVLVAEIEEISASLAALFRTRGWEVGIPLRINQLVIGLVALGRNKDFRIFSAEDLELLATVAAGASVALENASLSRQLRRSELVLERANRLSSLGMLAAGIAHEIRNPLVAVKTFLDLLPQRLEDHEFLSHFRELSLGELRRVTDLIADLLALGKSKTAERRAVELGPTLEPVVRLMESTARKRQIEVAAIFDPHVPAVWADPDQLKQIIVNLLLNAIETSSAGGHVKLDVRPAPPGSVVLEVRDDGPGIPANQLESIFHPFFTTKETGTGLGLALVHQMVVEHGGEITVESTVGRGSAFRVVLPTAPLALARTGT